MVGEKKYMKMSAVKEISLDTL